MITLLIASDVRLYREGLRDFLDKGGIVSVTGVTGIRTQMEDRAQDILMDLRTITDKPIGIGFGISQPEHAKQVMDWGADAVIVGSAFVKRLAEGTPAQGLRAIEEFCRSLKIAIASD